MALFDVSEEVYPLLVCLFYAIFETMESKERGKIYYTTKLNDHIITLTTASIERIFHLNPIPSKFPYSMSANKVRKLYLKKYAHHFKIKKSDQSHLTLYSDPGILHYILVRTICPWSSSK